MGGVEEDLLWGFTILFCCGIFQFDRLKCHRYMLENNIICDSAKAHNRL